MSSPMNKWVPGQENIFDRSTGGRSKLGLSGVWVGLYHGRDESQQEAGRESRRQRDSQGFIESESLDSQIVKQGVKEGVVESDSMSPCLTLS